MREINKNKKKSSLNSRSLTNGKMHSAETRELCGIFLTSQFWQIEENKKKPVVFTPGIH